MVLTTNWKAFEDHWMPRTIEHVRTSIDSVVYYGGNAYALFMRPDYKSEILAGNDYVRAALDYSHSKGLRFKIIFDSFEYYVTSRKDGIRYRDDIKNQPAARAAYLANIEWILQRYSGLDAFELEEPTFNDFTTPQLNKDFLNALFTDAKAIITKYHPNFDNGAFLYSYNSPSNYLPNVVKEGIDFAYINTNNLFNAYLIQNGGGIFDYNTVFNDYKARYRDWSTWHPTFFIINGDMVTWSYIYNNPPCNNTGTLSACWNQALFDELKWSTTNNQGMEIFILGDMWVPASLYPNDTTPGANAGNKVKYIWSSSNPCPTPICDYTITVI